MSNLTNIMPMGRQQLRLVACSVVLSTAVEPSKADKRELGDRAGFLCHQNGCCPWEHQKAKTSNTQTATDEPGAEFTEEAHKLPFISTSLVEGGSSPKATINHFSRILSQRI